jgi:amino acid transporter
MKKFKNPIISLIILTIVFSFSFLISSHCLAAGTITDQMKDQIKLFDLPSGGTNAESTVMAVIGKTIGAFLSVFGVIFLCLMIYGGYKWMMASGREEEVKSAKDTIRAAIIGLVIVVMAYAITFFVTTALQAAAK